MKKLGFKINLPDRLKPPDGGHRPDFLDRRYAPVYDEATASKYGYHLPEQVDSGSRLPPSDPAFTAEAQEAMWGEDDSRTPDGQVNVAAGRTTYGGCLGQAERQLAAGFTHVSFDFWAQPVRRLALDSSSDDDPRVLSAQAAWSSCMAERGYIITNTVSDENPEPHFDLSTPAPSTAEIAAALWNVACQKRTDVVQIAFQAETEYDLRKIEEQAEVFAQIKRENEIMMKRAADVVGDAP